MALGGSYGGMLAAWLRLRHPAAVVGALAASAPVAAFAGISEQYGSPPWESNTYWRVVTRDATPVAGAHPNCAPVVRASWPILRSLGRTKGGRRRLTSAFRLCAPLRDGEVWRLEALLLWVFPLLHLTYEGGTLIANFVFMVGLNR